MRGGIPVEVVQRLMGHQSITMTQRYTHVVSEDKIKAMNTLPEFEL